MDPSERLTTFGDESIKTSIEGFSVLNLFNIVGLVCFIKQHDKIVRNLNSIDNEEYLRNYDQPRGRTSSFERNMILDIV